jgi:hypothetical protein
VARVRWRERPASGTITGPKRADSGSTGVHLLAEWIATLPRGPLRLVVSSPPADGRRRAWWSRLSPALEVSMPAFIRLPDANVIHSTLQAARLDPTDQAAAKARKALLKSIGWSYDSLSDPQKAVAAQDYQELGPWDLAADVASMKAGRAVTDGQVQFMAREISAAGGKGRHTGAAGRFRGMLANERQAFQQALTQFKTYLDQINAGTHDALLDETFPNPDYFGAGQWNTRRQVRNTFQYAYDVVAGWEADDAIRNMRIRIDTYLDPQGAAGTSNQTNLLLSESFFTDPLNKRVYTLAHEATHAIQDADHVTLDNGGYIGELKWFDAPLKLRQENASHFQYVIERIQGRQIAIRPAATGGATAGGPESQATDILRKAWICALNEYGNMYSYANKAHPSAEDQDRARARGKLLGLPSGKAGANQVPQVSSVDLAGAENRVARLSLLFGAGGPVREAVQAAAQQNAQGPQVALTVDEILSRVVAQGGGPIRKTGNHEKTLEMIKTLAYLCHQNRGPTGPTMIDQWNKVDEFNNKQF